MDSSNMSRMINHLRINDTNPLQSFLVVVQLNPGTPFRNEQQDSSDHWFVLMMCIDGYTAPNSIDKEGFTTPHVSPF